MRIIAGTYRGFHLRSLKGANLRPTSDQMRQTLFDVLGPAVRGSRFLDGYAGSGAVGFEALSRGASEVVMVENHRAAVDLIGRNLKALGAPPEAVRVLASQVTNGLERLAGEGVQFDYVFLDPPYADVSEYHRVLRSLSRSPLVAPQSAVIVEHSRHLHLEESYGRLAKVRLLRHGDSQLAFYRLRADEPSHEPSRGDCRFLCLSGIKVTHNRRALVDWLEADRNKGGCTSCPDSVQATVLGLHRSEIRKVPNPRGIALNAHGEQWILSSNSGCGQSHPL